MNISNKEIIERAPEGAVYYCDFLVGFGLGTFESAEVYAASPSIAWISSESRWIKVDELPTSHLENFRSIKDIAKIIELERANKRLENRLTNLHKKA